MKERLSRVYLDDYPVTLMGDEAAPPLSRIVRAGGKRPDYVDVVLLSSPFDKKGRLLELDAIIDRAAEPTRPIYLRTIPHDVKPIYTANPGHGLSRPDEPEAPSARRASPDVDPVIQQLGAPPVQDRPPRHDAVGRAPPESPRERPETPGGAPGQAAGTTRAGLAARRAETQAKAEAEAEAAEDADDDRTRG